MTKTVLLYGDSIFWSLNASTRARHEFADRIDTIISKQLGEDYHVVSEGHRGWTMFGENGFFPQRNGLEQFGPIFASHLPIDVVVIMLGVNDLNTKTQHSAEDIAGALNDYETEAKSWCEFMNYPLPRFIVVSPTDIDEGSFSDMMKGIFEGAATEVANVATALQNIANKKEWTYIDSRSIARPIDTDGIHLDALESAKLAQAIANEISQIN